MRLLILNYVYPPLGRGAGISAKYQAEGLAGLGHDVTVLTTWFTGEEEIEDREHLKLIRLKSWRRKAIRSNPLEMSSWAVKAFRYIRENKLYLETDLILAHFSIPGGLVALPVKLLYKTPYYIISHGRDIPWISPKELFIYHLVFCLPIIWICSLASKITVLSQQRLNDLNRITVPKHRSKNHIIPNGCDVAFFSPPKGKKAKEVLRILFVGRLSGKNNPLILLEAMHFLTGTPTPFSLDIVGEGRQMRKMKSYVKDHHMDRWITFSGWESREELKERYRSAHLLISPSRDEDQSLVMMEAISSGLYLFTTPESGGESLILEGVNGEYIPPGGPLLISARIEAFYKEKVLKNYRIPRGTLMEMRESISWDKYVGAYDRIIKQ